MDIQNLLIHFVKGDLQSILNRLSTNNIKDLIKKIDKQTKIFLKVMGDTFPIPYGKRYNTIKEMLENELNLRKGGKK
jgi:hypothetical protein